jgi:hypothetical protein
MMVSDTICQEKDLVLLVRSKKVIKQVRKYEKILLYSEENSFKKVQ